MCSVSQGALSWSSVQYLEKPVSCILSGYLVVPGRRVNLVPITLSWLESEVHFINMYAWTVLGVSHVLPTLT